MFCSCTCSYPINPSPCSYPPHHPIILIVIMINQRSATYLETNWIIDYLLYQGPFYIYSCIHANLVISCAYHRLRHFKHVCMHKTTRTTHPAFCLVKGIISYFIQKVIFLKYIVTTARKPKSWKKSYLVQTLLPIASNSFFVSCYNLESNARLADRLTNEPTDRWLTRVS